MTNLNFVTYLLFSWMVPSNAARKEKQKIDFLIDMFNRKQFGNSSRFNFVKSVLGQEQTFHKFDVHSFSIDIGFYSAVYAKTIKELIYRHIPPEILLPLPHGHDEQWADYCLANGRGTIKNSK